MIKNIIIPLIPLLAFILMIARSAYRITQIQKSIDDFYSGKTNCFIK